MNQYKTTSYTLSEITGVKHDFLLDIIDAIYRDGEISEPRDYDGDSYVFNGEIGKDDAYVIIEAMKGHDEFRYLEFDIQSTFEDAADNLNMTEQDYVAFLYEKGILEIPSEHVVANEWWDEEWFTENEFGTKMITHNGQIEVLNLLRKYRSDLVENAFD